jgi:hypothetical protein
MFCFSCGAPVTGACGMCGAATCDDCGREGLCPDDRALVGGWDVPLMGDTEK